MALRSGERFVNVPLPGDGTFQPKAPNGGTDDYHCFLVDPKLTEPAALTGVQVLPGNSALVHHAILYKVDPEQVAAAKKLDAADASPGWSCFGGTLIPNPSGKGALDELNDAPWLAAWAPGAKESLFAKGSGVRLTSGTQVVLQMHYNLRKGSGTDDTQVQMRLTKDSSDLTSVHTMLLPGPVELPCAAGESGALCNRDNAVADVGSRFGSEASQTVAGLHLLCGGDMFNPSASPTQSCIRQIDKPTEIWAAAGHMHLLGKSISIDVNPGTPREKTILDIPVWDFDDQASRPLSKPVQLQAGDSVRVTCTHDASLRSKLPALQGTPPRYVVWGEGTTDEMCLGILIVTHPKSVG